MRQQLGEKIKIRNPAQLDLRLQTKRRGWPVIPSDGKGGLEKKWPTMANDEDAIENWHRPKLGMRDYPGTSVRVEGDMLVLDIDVTDSAVMRILLDRLWARWPEWFDNALERNSGAVKIALFGRVSEPIAATRTHRYQGQCVEVHGGLTTRQMVIHGPHSSHAETGREYAWVTEAPWQVDLADLPVFPADQIGELVDLCDAVLGEQLARDANSGPTEGPRTRYDLAPEDEFHTTDGDVWAIADLAEDVLPGEERRGVLGTREDWAGSSSKTRHSAHLDFSNRFMVMDYQEDVIHRLKSEAPIELAALDPEVVEALQAIEDLDMDDPDRPNVDLWYTDLVAHSPTGRFIYRPTRELWPSTTVDKRLRKVGQPPFAIAASTYIMRTDAVEQMSWVPGEPEILQDTIVGEGGRISEKGRRVYNMYRGPAGSAGGDPARAQPWLDHVNMVYPDEAGHIIGWLGFTAQFPGRKINHGLLLGGAPGIGKDTILVPMHEALGPWNCQDVRPTELGDKFNRWQRCVLLRVNEMHDLGDDGKLTMYSLYERMKVLLAAPPEVLRVNEKFLGEYYVPNVVKVAMTTNYKESGIYLPAEDRRTFVAWSPLAANAPGEAYFNRLYGWLQAGGSAHVAAYLRELDISKFNAVAPPPKTTAFWSIVNANRSVGDNNLEDVIAAMAEAQSGQPEILTVRDVQDFAFTRGMHDVANWLGEQKHRRHVPQALERLGYVEVPNMNATDRRWLISGRKHIVYRHTSISVRQAISRIEARPKQKGKVIQFPSEE